MAESNMEVDTAHLYAGADRCGDAAATALAAAGRLAEKQPMAGMFGDFAEAHEFHATILMTHQHHISQLQAHHRALGDIGDKGRSSADEFTGRDAAGADSLRAAEAGFDVR